MHPSGGMEREFRCRIHGEASRERIDRLRKGITLSGYPCRFERVRVRGGRGTNRWYDVVVREGRYREVRRMWSAIGCTVNRLIRIRYGGLSLPRDLEPGHHRSLYADQQTSGEIGPPKVVDRNHPNLRIRMMGVVRSGA